MTDIRTERPIHPGLLAEAGRIVGRMAAVRVADAQARYDFGTTLHTVRYAPESKYGPRPIEAIARCLNVDPSGLRRYARVAEMIGPDEFRAYMEARSPSGWPIGWAHLEKLSHVRSLARRTMLVASVLREDLPVRSLDAIIRTDAR